MISRRRLIERVDRTDGRTGGRVRADYSDEDDKRGFISRLSSYRGLGVTARGYVFFFLRFFTLSLYRTLALPDSGVARRGAARDGTRRCLFSSSRHHVPPLCPVRRASDCASIYLIGPGWPRGALNASRRVLSSGSRKSGDASRARFLRNPRRSAADNTTCPDRE